MLYKEININIMAIQTQVLLTVFRDKYAPFDPAQSKTLYNPPIGKSFNPSTIKSVMNIVEGGVTYGVFTHYPTDGSIREQVMCTQASGAIITACNL